MIPVTLVVSGKLIKWLEAKISEAYPGLSQTSKITRFEIIFSPNGIYLLKVNNRSTRTRCEICSKSAVFIVNFEHISHLALVFLLLTLNM